MEYEICPLEDITASGREIPWRYRKIVTLKLAASMQRLGIDQKAVYRVRYCGEHLGYMKNIETFDKRLMKRGLRFCKNPICPICQGRRSKKNYYQLKNVLKKVEDEQEGKTPKFILMTLTIQNIAAEDFSAAIGKLLKGFEKMVKKPRFQRAIMGYYRSLEVTVSKAGEYHPHLHILCMVGDDYFNKNNENYLKTEDLVQIWKKSLSVEYDPVCFMQRIKGEKGILEVSKYMTKATIFDQNDKNELDLMVYTLLSGLKGRRLTSFGGVLKNAAKELKIEQEDETKEDLLNLSGNHEQEEGFFAEENYYWDWSAMDYLKA